MGEAEPIGCQRLGLWSKGGAEYALTAIKNAKPETRHTIRGLYLYSKYKIKWLELVEFKKQDDEIPNFEGENKNGE